jgi:hypothetical protein
VSAAIYTIMLLPVLGIVQNGPQIVADRYSYSAMHRLGHRAWWAGLHF